MRIESFLDQSPVFQAARAARRMEAALNTVLKPEGLTLAESLMLAAIFLEKKRVRPSELARTFDTTRGNVSHTVSALEAKRLIRRRIDPQDARGFLLELEPAGKRRAARVAAILDRMQSHFEAEIGPTKLDAMLRQLRAVDVTQPVAQEKLSAAGQEKVAPQLCHSERSRGTPAFCQLRHNDQPPASPQTATLLPNNLHKHAIRQRLAP